MLMINLTHGLSDDNKKFNTIKKHDIEKQQYETSWLISRILRRLKTTNIILVRVSIRKVKVGNIYSDTEHK